MTQSSKLHSLQMQILCFSANFVQRKQYISPNKKAGMEVDLKNWRSLSGPCIWCWSQSRPCCDTTVASPQKEKSMNYFCRNWTATNTGHRLNAAVLIPEQISMDFFCWHCSAAFVVSVIFGTAGLCDAFKALFSLRRVQGLSESGDHERWL